MYGTPYMYIIQCKFLFLFNGPLMRNVVQLCLAANNILLMQKWNLAFSFFAITLAWKCRLLRFPKIFVKNELGNQMIKQFLNSVIVKYYDLSASKPKAEANNWSAQPCPILVNNNKAHCTPQNHCAKWLTSFISKGRMKKALIITNFLLIINRTLCHLIWPVIILIIK